IMAQHIGWAVNDNLQCLPNAAKVWNQGLDRYSVDGLAKLTMGFGINWSTAIFALITIYRCKHDMLKPHLAGRIGHARRLFPIELLGRKPRFYGAERTGTCANIPKKHEGSCSIAPAFPHIRAPSF